MMDILFNSLLFQGIEIQKIESLIQCSEKVVLTKGELFSERMLRENIFIPLSGIVKSYQVNPHNGKAYTIFLFHKGDAFDIITFIDQDEHEVLFEVVREGIFLKVSHKVLDQWVIDEPQFNKNILFLLSHMLLSLEQNASDLALYDTFTRLSKLILRHISSVPISQSIRSKVHLKHIDTLSHEEMAHLIGTAREVVSRHIKVLKEKKILQRYKQRHYIVNLEALLEQCHLPFVHSKT